MRFVWANGCFATWQIIFDFVCCWRRRLILYNLVNEVSLEGGGSLFSRSRRKMICRANKSQFQKGISDDGLDEFSIVLMENFNGWLLLVASWCLREKLDKNFDKFLCVRKRNIGSEVYKKRIDIINRSNVFSNSCQN